MSTARPILIVEDDDALRQVLIEHLDAESALLPTGVATLSEATICLSAADARFDAIVLDINLPDGDGRDFCLRLRAQGQSMPIIMLTGRSEESDVVRGLHAGASDYISKPFRAKELLARIHAQLRLFDNSLNAVFTIGPYSFRPAAKLLVNPKKKQRIRLTEKEVKILKFLYKAGDRVVSRQTLLDEVWGYQADVTTHTLETHIYRLRQKMEDDPAECQLLVTRGGGYQLNSVG